jgi:hypothetical protein
VLLPALLLVTGCGSSYTAPALATRLGQTFANLYVRSESLVGRTDVTASALHVTTSCQRGGGDTLDQGPGDDWRCLVTFRDPTLGPKQVLYEVALKPEGCFTAEGPPLVVGDARLVLPDGTTHVNPIYAFDGCL